MEFIKCSKLATKSPKMKKIAVPFDGSKFSKHAFDMALNLAQKYKSKIVLMTVIEKLNGSWYAKELHPYYKKQVIKQKEKLIRELSKLETIAKKKKISCTSKIFVSDHIADQLLRFTKANGFDIIVMGSHGKGGLEKIILGSVANGVIQRSKIPVLIVH